MANPISVRVFDPALIIALTALASLACGLSTPASVTPPAISSGSGNLVVMAQSLKQVQEEGGQANAVIFTADPERNYYVQFAGAKGQPELYAEAVSNQYIPQAYALSDEQSAQLEAMGWSLQPGGNYIREFEASSDDERMAIAKEVLRVFVEVYGVSADAYIDANLILQ